MQIKKIIVYIIGLFILAFGITMNTKTHLGVSPIISIAYNVSTISGISLGIMTFVFYALMILMQFILLGRAFKPIQTLQIVVSLITSVFIQFFDTLLPTGETSVMRAIMLIIAIVCTGIGASLTVNMHLIPNPADALASVIGEKCHRGFGFGKNLFDCISLLISGAIGFIFTGHLIGIGIGTVCAMIFTGRVIAMMQKPCEIMNRSISK